MLRQRFSLLPRCADSDCGHHQCGGGFYSIYHKVASGQSVHSSHDHTHDEGISELTRDDLENYRAFLRSLLMHAGVGTALGGVTTMVGEPQNLIIADQAGWQFGEFLLRMAPVTVPVFIAGMLTCMLVENSAFLATELVFLPMFVKFCSILTQKSAKPHKPRRCQTLGARCYRGLVDCGLSSSLSRRWSYWFVGDYSRHSFYWCD